MRNVQGASKKAVHVFGTECNFPKKMQLCRQRDNKKSIFGYSEHFSLHFPPSLKYLRRVTVSNLILAKKPR